MTGCEPWGGCVAHFPVTVPTVRFMLPRLACPEGALVWFGLPPGLIDPGPIFASGLYCSSVAGRQAVHRAAVPLLAGL